MSYEKDVAEIIVLCEKNVIEEVDRTVGPLKQSELNSLYMSLKQSALQEVSYNQLCSCALLCELCTFYILLIKILISISISIFETV